MMPAVFIGHGNPLNALQQNHYTAAWAAIGAEVPRPRAVLCVSAHWYVAGTALTVNTAPRTIHDFGGFPPELYKVQYPAPGDPQLARRVRQLLAPLPVELSGNWGLDHGTWSVLRHVYPQADVPVVQLSIDSTQAAAFHYEIGQRLAPLREEGILILGSGNLVHNLHAYAWGGHAVEPYDWAVNFERRARELIMAGDHAALVNYQTLGEDARLSIPTPDHYLPLLYVLGAGAEGEPVDFPVEGVDGGSISMLAARVSSASSGKVYAR
jgi:4,5-DOPA dioxygenase extradiol